MSTKFLEQHAKTLAAFAKETADASSESPDDFWLRAAVKVQHEAAAKAARELALARADEAGELIGLRFIGPRADGSIPLDAFVKIMEPLTYAWKAAAHRLRYGRDDLRVATEISDLLDLRLAGLAYGSTRVFVTGNGAADLTGESLLQATLVHVFKLLTATRDDFHDAADSIGGKAASSLAEALKAIDAAGFSAELTWQSPSCRWRWDGKRDEIVRFRNWVESMTDPEEYEEEVAGIVAAIKDTGRFELRTEDGKIVVRYPLALTTEVQKLTIAKPARVAVITAKYRDSVAKRDIYTRHLKYVL
ncbi:hypothetical protein [Cupriavidus pampae]|uniref:Uncharacterized protein n=1 Tax=Cupriavidus pampae TaxID=659251 RepID=A0ABM8XEG4_9BURK|nr:hypothetical protein [Cupriavidus pampae]CAG9178494.1 hypothetical protein LMG32289_04059 [Cupriavidus pampae]